MKIGDLPILPDQASAGAAAVDTATLVVLSVCSAILLAVLVAMVFLLIRYRKNSVVDRSNPPISDARMELTWIIIPTLLSVAMFWAGAKPFYDNYQLPTSTDITLEVVGEQWLWTVYYPNGHKEHNTLHVPRGQRVTLRMISQDVIHSFFIPDFRVKHDVLPGRYSYLWFEPTQLGDFHLFCSEYCGTAHSKMEGWVHVMEPAEYSRWLAGQKGTSPAERGKLLFEQSGCASCHRGLGTAAPRLDGLFGRMVNLEDGRTITADDDYLRRSIVEPQKEVVAGYGRIMPTYQGRLTEPQLLDLEAYLRSLGSEVRR